jgi:hypothetical protein
MKQEAPSFRVGWFTVKWFYNPKNGLGIENKEFWKEEVEVFNGDE